MEEAVAAKIMSGELVFPSKATFLPPPETLFANLRDARYVELKTNPLPRRGERRGKNRRSGPFRPRGGPRLPMFDGGFLEFVVNAAAYDAADSITDHFTETARLAAHVRGRESPLSAWRRPKAAARIAKLAVQQRRLAAGSLELAQPCTSPEWTRLLREACYETMPECTQFKTTIAKQVYEFFETRVTLDPFAGWGDRAIGAAAAGVVKYVGVDPNSRLVDGHAAVERFLAAHSDTKVTFVHGPFENFDAAEHFAAAPPDLVFSSPPFFDVETYSDEKTQSLVQHPTRDRWLREWFLPVTDRAWSALAPGGHLVYYLAGREFTAPLVKHMEKHADCYFRGTVGCRRGRKRPIPLWIWTKRG